MERETEALSHSNKSVRSSKRSYFGVWVLVENARGGTHNTQVSVHGCNSLVGAGLQQLGGDDLFDRQHDTILTPDADGGAAVLDCLYGIFDLEIAAVGGEDGVGEVVARAYGCLRCRRGRTVSIHGCSLLGEIGDESRGGSQSEAYHFGGICLVRAGKRCLGAKEQSWWVRGAWCFVFECS